MRFLFVDIMTFMSEIVAIVQCRRLKRRELFSAGRKIVRFHFRRVEFVVGGYTRGSDCDCPHFNYSVHRLRRTAGSIPGALGNLKALMGLFICNNRLTGETLVVGEETTLKSVKED